MHSNETFIDRRSALDGDVNGILRGRRVRSAGWALGGLAALGVGAIFDAEQALRSYLFAYLFVLSFGLGSLGLILLHNTTGGAWGDAIRRPLEAGARTLPFLALAFLPVLLGAGTLYEWAHPEVVASDPLLQHKAPYLNLGSWRIRAAVYFGVWLIVSLIMRGEAAQEGRNDLYPTRSQKVLSGFGMALYCLTMTFASIDWAMSLEPHWFSTLYGVIFIVGQVLSTLCLMVVLTAWLVRRQPVISAVGPGQLHDLGNLTFAFVMLWGYMGLSQFLIIWSANLAEEAPWYLARSNGGWQWIAGLLAALHFFLPFFLLLMRGNKRSPEILGAIALFLIGMRVIDLFWLIKPAFHPGHFAVSALDLFAVIGLSAAWFYVFTGRLLARPLVYHPAPRSGEATAAATAH